MTTILIFWLTVMTAVCCWASWRLITLSKNLHHRDAENARLQKDLHGLLLCMRGVSDRFDQHQKQLRSVTVRQNDIASKNVSDSHYQQAAFMMDKGASVDDLMKSCGLSRGEAEMMARINHMHQEPPNDVFRQNQAGLR